VAQESGTGVQFEVERVDVAYQELQAQGFTLMATLWYSPRCLVTLHDPDNNIIGLIDNTRRSMPG
jgi:hypothetical protein